MPRIGTTKLSPQTGWFEAGSITSEEAALAVDERDVATAEALGATKVVTIKPQGNPAAILLRFRADDAADLDSVLEMYAARGAAGGGDDFYSRIATLTITTGTQDTGTSTIHFIDEIVATNEQALFDGEEGTTLSEMIGLYYFRTFGYSRFMFVASDRDSTTIYIDCCYLYE